MGQQWLPARYSYDSFQDCSVFCADYCYIAGCLLRTDIALATLQHLSRLDLRSLLVPNAFTPGCFLALALGLSGRTAWRSLTLANWDVCKHAYTPEVLREMRGASASLAYALGSLSVLTQLAISNLEPVLGLMDCYLHLRPLGSLRALVLEHSVVVVEPGAHGLSPPRQRAQQGGSWRGAVQHVVCPDAAISRLPLLLRV